MGAGDSGCTPWLAPGYWCSSAPPGSAHARSPCPSATAKYKRTVIEQITQSITSSYPVPFVQRLNPCKPISSL